MDAISREEEVRRRQYGLPHQGFCVSLEGQLLGRETVACRIRKVVFPRDCSFFFFFFFFFFSSSLLPQQSDWHGYAFALRRHSSVVVLIFKTWYVI